MKIKMISNYAGPVHGSHPPGTIWDAPAADAQALIEGGFAAAVAVTVPAAIAEGGALADMTIAQLRQLAANADILLPRGRIVKTELISILEDAEVGAPDEPDPDADDPDAVESAEAAAGENAAERTEGPAPRQRRPAQGG